MQWLLPVRLWWRLPADSTVSAAISTAADTVLRAELKVEEAAGRVANYLNCSFAELETFARITGHENVHDLNLEDLATISREISEYTDIAHV